MPTYEATDPATAGPWVGLKYYWYKDKDLITYTNPESGMPAQVMPGDTSWDHLRNTLNWVVSSSPPPAPAVSAPPTDFLSPLAPTVEEPTTPEITPEKVAVALVGIFILRKFLQKRQEG